MGRGIFYNVLNGIRVMKETGRLCADGLREIEREKEGDRDKNVW